MTTKYRIITGFLLMVALLAALALVGERGLSRATSNFAGYDRISKLNVLLSDMYREVYAAAYNVESFMQEYDSGLMDTAQQKLDSAVNLGTQAADLIQLEERKASMKASLNELRQYRGFSETIRKNVLEAQRLYREVFLVTAESLGNELSTINTNGRARNNVDAMYVAHNMREGMMRMQVAFATYMEVLSADQEKIAADALTEAIGRLRELDAVMTSDLGRRDFARISKAFEELNACFLTLRALISEASTLVDQTQAINRRAAALVEDLNSEIDQEMLRTSRETVESNQNARASMLTISGVGMILGLVMAAFIIITLIRVLHRMSAFAEAVARGDFQYDAGIREKGEIGEMVIAMRKIPDTLSDVVSRCGVIANDVACGRFKATLQTEGLEGGFRDLARAVNTVGDSYAAVIDTLPVSIMTADTRHVMQYCNATPNAIVSPDMIGTVYGGKSHNAESANEAANLGTRCMQSGASEPAEMSVTTPEGRKAYTVIASPLKDLSGKAVGFMEIITDITLVKDQEERMRAVAEQASVISDRVAAAAEELAAQVEQISRGAEMQRERVETTASAMTQMNSTVLEVARNASQASDQSDATRQNAISGADLVDKVVAAINDVNRVGTRLQTNMEGLGEQAENIGGVMGVISDIADQTNLLALNAAIEAARAGEAGRGFAVVADEVRKLAEKTMTATQEVGSSISAVQHSAHLNMEEVAEAVRNVIKATDLANSSGAALGEIVDLASATSSVVSSIAAAAEQQSAASEQITGAIEEINKV
ncbi:methyl-accepting chemotaxis protein, partial [Desulfovibrio sp. OttesenSCG-928-I05]|nr:methyl-accepting chemotaxis protein [Desulfovibrio sp. OttesenSCG-928-I05]